MFRTKSLNTGIGLGPQCPRAQADQNQERRSDDETVFFHARLDVSRGGTCSVQGEFVGDGFIASSQDESFDSISCG